MKINKITAECSLTLNLRNYNSAKVALSQEVIIENGDNVEEVTKTAFENCKNECKVQLQNIKNKMAKS